TVQDKATMITCTTLTT
nr:immunoglobulin heavy chain junction region [Mus musculus]